ncbi:hypothetical protein [Arthrobacter sp. RCC_34]|uniref:hypothetical protein n=1 Tax=Arthrobacter sp. RCC_34 TaxID=3239230 RepID=UPI003525F006
MDITESLAPKSDQLDAVELVTPRTFTIEKVTPNNAEQPWNFHLAGFPRPWRPAKSMLRVIAKAWGTDATKYAGRSVTLFCDPTVQFGGQAVGGVRISHMSHIDGPLKMPLLIKRGKSAIYVVEPLTAAPTPRNWRAEADKIAGNEPKLKALWTEAQKNGASPDDLNYIKEAATNG